LVYRAPPGERAGVALRPGLHAGGRLDLRSGRATAARRRTNVVAALDPGARHPNLLEWGFIILDRRLLDRTQRH